MTTLTNDLDLIPAEEVVELFGYSITDSQTAAQIHARGVLGKLKLVKLGRKLYFDRKNVQSEIEIIKKMAG